MSAIAGVMLVLFAATALAGWLALRFPAFDLINNLLPVWLSGGIVAAVVIIVCGGWRRTLIAGSVILAVSALPPIVRDLSGRPPIGEGSGHSGLARPLKLIQFNALKDNRTPGAVAAWIRHERPDIVTMEETLGSSRVILRLLRAL